MAKKEEKVKPMSKGSLIKYMMEKTGLRKAEVELFFEELQNVAYKECKNPRGFTLPGFGKLMLKDRKARMGRNPATGEQIKIAAKTVLKFRLAKAAKIAVLGAPPKKVKKVVNKVDKKVDKKKKKK